MALDLRKPGGLPNVLARVERARELLTRLPEDDPEQAEVLQGLIEAILAMASTQHELNRRLWDRYLSLPFPHAPQHKGGDDSVEGRQLPSAITFGALGAIGDPTLGYSPISHIHDTFGITKQRVVQCAIDGIVGPIGTGLKGYSPPLPYTGTITGWDIVADQPGNIVFDVWKDTWMNFPPTVADSIVGSEPPTLAGQQKAQDLELTTWTDVQVALGDVFGFYVDSTASVQKVTLTVRVTPT